MSEDIESFKRNLRRIAVDVANGKLYGYYPIIHRKLFFCNMGGSTSTDTKFFRCIVLLILRNTF